MLRSLGLLLALTLAVGCGPAKAGPAASSTEPVAIQTLAQGSRCGVTRPAHQVIQDPQAWAQVWAQVKGNQLNPPLPPEVDFSRSMVLAVFMGRRSSGGHQIQVSGVNIQGETWLVEVTETSPGPGCLTTQAITQPFHLALAPAHAGPVRFVTIKKIKACR